MGDEILERDLKEIEEIKSNLDHLERFNFVNHLGSAKKLVITDCDECICNITLKWVRLLVNAGILADDITIDSIFNRKEYDISNIFNFEYLKKFLTDDIKDAHDLAMKVYAQEDFYDDLSLTALGKSLKSFLDGNLIELVIISHTIEENRKSKENFLKKFYPNAEIYLINPGERKSTYFNKKELNNYSTFIDDSLSNIYDVMLNTNSIGKEFIIPKYGYNDIWYFPEDCDVEEEFKKKKPTELDIGMFEIINEIGCKIVYVDPLDSLYK